MRHLGIISFVMSSLLAIVPNALCQTADNFTKLGSKPFMGYVTRSGNQTSYNVILNISLEQWEQGKRAEHRDQQWFLECIYPSSGKTLCKLQRTILDRVFPHLGTVASETEHSTVDGTIELVKVDWPRGKFDFNVVHGDGSKTNVFIDMVYERDAIYLRELKAGINGRGVFGAPATIEFRVPEYTYTQNVPIVMAGMREAWEKEWDAMIHSLASGDRLEIQKLVAARFEITGRVLKAQESNPEAQKLRALLPQTNNEDRAASAEIVKKLTELADRRFFQEIEAWLEQSQVSIAGRGVILEFFRTH